MHPEDIFLKIAKLYHKEVKEAKDARIMNLVNEAHKSMAKATGIASVAVSLGFTLEDLNRKFIELEGTVSTNSGEKNAYRHPRQVIENLTKH